MSTTWDCKDIVIRKSELVAKTQVEKLKIKLNFDIMENILNLKLDKYFRKHGFKK